jgi:membrane fusion protein (multidrug efflux system)
MHAVVKACTGSVAALLVLASTPAHGQTLTFQGRVEAYQQAEVSSRLDGVVVEILFAGGEAVTVGMPLIVLDAADAELALAAATADRDRARATLANAEQGAARTATLGGRGIASTAELEAADLAVRVAEAELSAAEVLVAKAELARERTVVRAPIDGLIGHPATTVGAFVEAEAGAPLADIVQLDPVRIAYRVPYETRLATFEEAGVATISELLEQIELTIEMPGGRLYPHHATPEFASATVDPSDGTVMVWSSIANPDGLLRPGMAVTVHSERPSSAGAVQ